MACKACERISEIVSGVNPYFIAELDESYAVIADDQPYEGWTILLLKDHCEHLAELPIERQLRLFNDVAHVAAALRAEFEPVRINYECLGNLMHHIHWHVIPRYADDPDPLRPIWLRPEEELQVGVGPSRLETLVERMRKALDTV